MNKLGILDCDQLAEELRGDYKHYAAMFERLLAPCLTDFSFERFAVVDDQWPTAPEQCNAYLITGSKAGVYDDLPWLNKLEKFLQRVYAQRIPMIGICFGHQMLAQSLGGLAQKSAKGWGVGAYLTEATPDALARLDAAPTELALIYSHQDQVERLPPQAVRLYGNDFCPNAAFIIPERVLSFQGHPEFTIDYSQRLMSMRQNRYAQGQYERALRSLELPLQADWVARTMAQFILDPKNGSEGRV